MRHFLLLPLSYLLLSLLLLACKTEPPEPPLPPPAPAVGQVFILNEGNFLSGNASVDRYDPTTKQLESGVFAAVNQRPLGDVLQSVVRREDRAYLVVNNSNRVEVIQADSLHSLGSIVGLGSPRYCLPVSAEKAYFSDLFAGAIAIVDLESQQVRGQIPLPGWTEQMILLGEWVFVANVERPFVYVINSGTDELVDSIAVGLGCSQLQLDATGNIWLGCGESLLDSVPGRLFQIDPDGRAVKQVFPFPTGEKPGTLALNPTKDTLYYLNQGVYALPIASPFLPGEALIPANGSLFYGLGVDPERGDLYVADAVDYVQRGWVLRHHPDGRLLDEFQAGIIPGGFGFW
jgi:hypothetical protein